MSPNNSRKNSRLNDASPITSPSGLDGWLKSNAPRDDGIFFGFENFKSPNLNPPPPRLVKNGLGAVPGAESASEQGQCESRASGQPEVWAPVLGREGRYEVSTWGRVKTLVDARRRRTAGSDYLREWVNEDGYSCVTLTERDGRRAKRRIHALVLEAFVGPRPAGMEACHDPYPDRTNCRLDNLRWDTPKANAADKRRHNKQRKETACAEAI